MKTLTPNKLLLLGATICVVAWMIDRNVSRVAADVDTVSSRQALQGFEVFALMVAGYLLLKSASRPIGVADLITAGLPLALSPIGLAGLPVTVLAICLFCGSRGDIHKKAAATVLAALAVQTVWAPIVFDWLSDYLLPLDAAAAGYALSTIMPGSTWDHSVVTSSNGFSIVVTAGCSSFHNLSLAALCWVTVTMMQRPRWVARDPLVGLLVASAQILSNVIRLVLVAVSEPMYQFWHDGTGKHVFSAAGTFAAILIVSLGAPWAAEKAAAARSRASLGRPSLATAAADKP